MSVSPKDRRNWRPLTTLQLEAADCGYICASVLAAMHGFAHSVESLKLRCGSSNRGLTVSQLKHLMSCIKLPCDAISIAQCSPSNFPTPCIGLTVNQHYVVLGLRRGRGKRDVFDPEKGWHVVLESTLCQSLQGVVLRIKPSVSLGEERAAIPPIWPLFRGIPLARPVGVLLLLGLISLGAQLVLPNLAGVALDASLAKEPQFGLDYFAMAYVSIAVAAMFTQSIATLRGAILGAYVNKHLGSWLYARLLRQPVEYLERHSPNVLRAFFDSAASLQYLVTQHAVQVVIGALLAVTCLGVMALSSLALTLASVVLVGALLLTQWLFRYHHLRAKENLFQAGVLHQGFVLDSLSVAPSLIRYGGVLNAAKVHDSLLNQVAEAAAIDAKVSAMSSFARQSLVQLDRLLFIVIGMYLLQKSAMTFGAFVAFGLYRDLFRNSADSIMTALTDYWSLRFQRLRLAPLLNERHHSAASHLVQSGVVRLSSVTFQYTMFEPVILNNFNLQVGSGEFALIQGPSGVGKSTVARLLLGLSTPQKGTVEIDGELASGSMQAVASVLQGDSLIADTIAQNILLYRDGFAQSDVERAASLACAHEFIEELPMKYLTVVSEKYSGLSAGQRQRLLLARALLGQPKLLILDEATSHVDPATESRMMENLANLSATKVVISHRIDISVYADQVIKLANGRSEETVWHPTQAALARTGVFDFR